MSTSKPPLDPDEETPASAKAIAKKPYRKPAFSYETVFETMALACGKITNAGACKTNKKNS